MMKKFNTTIRRGWEEDDERNSPLAPLFSSSSSSCSSSFPRVKEILWDASSYEYSPRGEEKTTKKRRWSGPATSDPRRYFNLETTQEIQTRRWQTVLSKNQNQNPPRFSTRDMKVTRITEVVTTITIVLG